MTLRATAPASAWIRCLVFSSLLGALVAVPAAAQEEAAGGPETAATEVASPTLPVSEAQEFLGEWVVTMESFQGEFETDFAFREVDGKVVGELEMPDMGTQTITDISRSEEGLDLRFALRFGSQQFKIKMEVAREEDRLVGKLADESGFFTIELTGITRQEALALATAEGLDAEGVRRRRGRRRGNNETTELKLAGTQISIRYDKANTEQDAYQTVLSPKEGEVVGFLRHRPGKLTTDADLRFGDAVVRYGNAAEDYPGVYSLWLKSVNDRWHLVFNGKPDVWGTQHDPEADVAEVPLDFATTQENAETLTMKLEEGADGSGFLRIAWGSHEWTTPFSVAESP